MFWLYFTAIGGPLIALLFFFIPLKDLNSRRSKMFLMVFQRLLAVLFLFIGITNLLDVFDIHTGRLQEKEGYITYKWSDNNSKSIDFYIEVDKEYKYILSSSLYHKLKLGDHEKIYYTKRTNIAVKFDAQDKNSRWKK
ncbi:hypothetical protein BKP45_02905 [Anaerobacillus alkalidiazotrophicus]|uniref:Uncharacterized protein n=1 Tax=Anaerobacillus alkalidiazotrophicus TaxID=472963 RepID=A0A1S2MDD2_9BACI|nr:hypothetical protein [Anaerobacillus alkalidiazotrophicus]OIJ21685.1 hypothetical protein BKP45_02905 [Anaerobacillus alkalidiazotrophicus]